MNRQQKEVKLDVRSSKMPSDVQKEALDAAKKAIERGSEPRVIANEIKKYFDDRYAPNWHCIVGNHFASACTYTSDNFIDFNCGKMAILLWKTE